MTADDAKALWEAYQQGRRSALHIRMQRLIEVGDHMVQLLDDAVDLGIDDEAQREIGQTILAWWDLVTPGWRGKTNG